MSTLLKNTQKMLSIHHITENLVGFGQPWFLGVNQSWRAGNDRLHVARGLRPTALFVWRPVLSSKVLAWLPTVLLAHWSDVWPAPAKWTGIHEAESWEGVKGQQRRQAVGQAPWCKTRHPASWIGACPAHSTIFTSEWWQGSLFAPSGSSVPLLSSHQSCRVHIPLHYTTTTIVWFVLINVTDDSVIFFSFI